MTKNKGSVKFKCFPSDSLEVSSLHSILLSAVAPRPIAFASTRDKEANPPLMIFSPARRVRDNTTKHTLQNVMEHPEVVINVVNFNMVEQMSLASTEYDKGINEFLKAGFTQLEGEYVSIPRIAEAPVAFECAVDQVIETGDQGGAGNLVICRVLNVIIQEEYLDEKDALDLQKLDLVGRMGGNYYVRASGNALFEIPKPIKTKGIGVDSLPQSARLSRVLTGNNLGRLGNMEKLPTEKQKKELVVKLKEQGKLDDDPENLVEKLHKEAVRALESGNGSEALALIWVAETLIQSKA
jgi:flavin reductase (DIM6/NTAB) family NADH-FMN oxidoreductase RutF